MNWEEFKIEKVIKEETRSKHLALHLKHLKNSSNAIVLLDKTPFNSAESFETILEELEAVDTNDIYHRFINHAKGIECKAIYPSTESHLKKYSEQSKRIVLETPEMHSRITRPYYESLRKSGQISWIDNILADQSEMERRIIDKKCPLNGFILLPDYKWTDESNLISFYLLVIVRRKDLWSLRDLTADHLPILKDIRKEIEESVTRYKYPDGSPLLYNHLRVYFHYPPTYPHLHIHINLASAQTSSSVGQAVLLDEVIDNLQNVASAYYRSVRTLVMEFGENHELYMKLSE